MYRIFGRCQVCLLQSPKLGFSGCYPLLIQPLGFDQLGAVEFIGSMNRVLDRLLLGIKIRSLGAEPEPDRDRVTPWESKTQSKPSPPRWGDFPRDSQKDGPLMTTWGAEPEIERTEICRILLETFKSQISKLPVVSFSGVEQQLAFAVINLPLCCLFHVSTISMS